VRRIVSRVRSDNFCCAALFARAGINGVAIDVSVALWSEAFNQRSNGQRDQNDQSTSRKILRHWHGIVPHRTPSPRKQANIICLSRRGHGWLDLRQ